MRVLIVEDDRALGQYLKRGMEMEGHGVTWAGDGDEALREVMSHPPDLMLLDLNLPKRDGADVLEIVHRLYAGVCVLVLTGRGQVEERVRCLNLGADDCMVKPFSFLELAARCRALLRRKSAQASCSQASSPQASSAQAGSIQAGSILASSIQASSAQASNAQASPVLRCGSLVLDRMERAVECEGRQVALTVKEFALLEYLLRNQGSCVSRSVLLEEVWRSSPEAGTNVVDVYVNYLRRKLAEGKSFIPGETALMGGEWIETVRGRGYRLRDAAGEREAAREREAVRESEEAKLAGGEIDRSGGDSNRSRSILSPQAGMAQSALPA